MAMFRGGVSAMRGFSLVELLVAITIGLVVVGTVTSVYLSSKQSYRLNQALAEIQENARFALEFLKRDIRMAGLWGCADPNVSLVAHSVNGGGSWRYRLEAIRGYEGGVDTFPDEYKDKVYSGSNVSSDSVVLHFASGEAFRVTGHNPHSAVISLDRNHPFEKGETLIIVEKGCTHMGIFQATPGTEGNKVKHNSGQAVSPGNCTKAIKAVKKSWDCSNPPPPGQNEEAYNSGSRVMRFNAYAYYVGTGESGEPGLMRYDAGRPTEPQELVSGVEEMQLCYLTKDDGYWKRANEIDDWNEVVAVRIALVVRSSEKFVTPTEQIYKIDLNCDGDTDDPGETRPDPGQQPPDRRDRRLRRVYTTTVTLRNWL